MKLPGFSAIFAAMPFQIRNELIDISAYFMAIVAVASQLYSEGRFSRLFLRQRFRFALIVMVAGFSLFAFLRNELTVTVPKGQEGGSTTVLIGFSPTKDCFKRCADPVERQGECITKLSLDPRKIEGCWGATSLKRAGLLLKLSYVLFTGGLAGLIGLALLWWEIRDARRFRVAFSFAGAQRPYVAKVATMLAACFGKDKILYDEFHVAELARCDLGVYLPAFYKEKSDLVVVVVCPDYKSREWCGLEWEAISGLLKQRRDEEVMLCRFKHASLEGLPSTAGFMELDDQPEDQTATRILERLAVNEGKPKDYYLPMFRRALPRRVSRRSRGLR